MAEQFPVFWTERSLKNAEDIISYLQIEFTSKEIDRFFELLKNFERTISHFPLLYPSSQKYPNLKRAVLSKELSLYYEVSDRDIVVIAMQDNRQSQPK